MHTWPQLSALMTLAALAAITACSSQNQRPDWLDNPQASYPPASYLSASGTADSREAAAERALANLARVFNVAVSDTSMDFSSARVERSGDNAALTNTQQASRLVTAQALQVLEGARIAESWQAPDGSSHSLAVLDKGPAAQRFRRDIGQADRRTADLVSYASGPAPTPVAALSALEQARLLQLERDALNRNLSVVSGQSIRSPHPAADIEHMIRQGLARLSFATRGDSENMAFDLQAAIASLGIRHQPDSRYELRGGLDLAPLQQREGWYWLRGSLQLRLLDRGSEIARRRWPVKVSATDAGTAEQRARDLTTAALPGYVYDMISSSPAGLQRDGGHVD
ncbi:MAG: LPP20 family lipoprotein [Rubrivivax sp.]|nr:LPP20 family lipoprotein [Rubrivivax sp.]